MLLIFPRVAAGHGEWSEYSVERTARVVASKFPLHAVWVVLPKAHVNGALASYDNFAGTDWESGGAVPECECVMMLIFTDIGYRRESS